MEQKGKVLMQKYELGRLLGQGTFAKVYHARNLITGMSVAVKVVDKEKVLKVGMVEQIKREISAMKLVRHPNVVELYEVMATKTKIFIIMEYAKGGELFNKIVKGRLKVDVARGYFQQLMSAVDYCHSRGVCHRDLKPENLLLDENENLKVSDFGLSALSESKHQDGLLHTTCGTPAYVAPEVINRKGYDGSKADLWSCGVILFVLLAGSLPFQDQNLMEMYRKISEGDFRFPKWFALEVRRLLSKILDPNPKTRISMAKIMESSWFKKGLEKPIVIETENHELPTLHADGVFAFAVSEASSRNSPRGIFCTRTLNLRSISAIGYDMDYTLIHYNVKAWEGRAYDYCMENLKNMGFPVDGLAFDPDLVIRGLVIDKERGNLVKADRFGYVKRAMHGTKMLSTRAVSEMYGRELVDLRKESRWEFLNTLFSVSEAVAYMQMVDRLDDGTIPAELGPLDYKGLYKAVGKALFWAHVEGRLKSEIMSKPEQFVEPDPELPLALLDQKEAGKKLVLITNSDFHYTDKMMRHSFNRFLPNDMGWRDLFDIVIVSARKPEFFQTSSPMYEVVTGEGLMRPCFKAQPGGLYSGGSAQMVENSLGIHGDEILYVGDHIYTDVSQSKLHLRWRTALICRELEEEYNALINCRSDRESLIELINQKEIVGDLFNQLRLALQRRSKDRPAQTLAATNMEDEDLTESMQKLLIVMQRLDDKIAPMLESDGELFNSRWGFLSRAGLWDKSHLMRQIEKYADIYTSRVSNFLYYTPFMYFRSQEQNLAHDSYAHYCSQINNEASS